MILATIIPSHVEELRQLLGSMNYEPGLLDPANALISFGQFDKLHFARVLILDDQTLDDITVYGLPKVNYPTYLAILGDSDGRTDEFLAEMAERAGEGLRRIFAHCEGYAPGADLLGWMKARNLSPTANYINWIGRTVQQVKEEDALREAIETFLQKRAESPGEMQPRQLWNTLKQFAADEVQQGRITLTPPEPTPLGWQIRNLLHLLGIPILTLILSPLILLGLPFFLIQLRRCEKSDPEIAPRVDPDHANLLSALEDHDVTNQFSAMGSLKPGWFRRADHDSRALRNRLYRKTHFQSRQARTGHFDSVCALGFSR